jgi:hypothetical protein
VTHAIAFRWRPTQLPAEPRDIVRVAAHGSLQLALLANGFECGFSACWPPASRKILDLYEAAWAATSGSPEIRLLAAFEQARTTFIREAPALLEANADFPDDKPSAVLLAVALEATRVHAAWIGGDLALVARNGTVAHATIPHTLALTPGLPNFLARHISETAPDQSAPTTLSAERRPDDTVILLSRAVFRGPCVTPDQAAREAAAQPNLNVLAERLADLGFSHEDAAYAAVAVVGPAP